ncbi:YfjI family protein [Altericroceibacterium xinjiangense]|uniref:YfjI family protein n=1 Tax=Altericroceibacterium xinjiangense TaxID=762261 RepID=UPI0013DEC188|nr:YfjI family protein [Altericroceibacterium xinjiangense]
MANIDPARLDAAETIGPCEGTSPQPLVREIPTGLPYPVEVLGPLRPAVEAVQRRTQAPVAIPAQSALSVAALAVQGFANVETLGGWAPLSLYCLTVAASGERKSSCDAPLMAAMREFEREQAAIYREARKERALDLAIWKKRHDTLLGKMKNGAGDKAELAALGPEPAPLPLPDRLVSEPTYEGLTRLFAEGQPSLGLFSDEGGQFLGGFAMSQDNKQKTLAALNDLWMGNPIKRTRQGDGAFTLHGRRLSLHLMVQPVVAHGFLADPLAGDTGFLPRCLVCQPESTIGFRLHDAGVRDDAPVRAFADRLNAILNTEMAMDLETRELRPRRLPLSSEAKALLIRFSDNVERAQRPGGEMEPVRGHASKAAEQAARIAGVLTLWRDLEAAQVSGDAMECAIKLALFYLCEAQRLANAATLSDAVSKAEALRKWMLSPSWGKPWLTVRDVLRRGPNRLRESPEAKKAVQMLVEHHWLAPLPPGTEIEGQVRREAWRICQ